MNCDNCQGSKIIQIAGRDYCTTCGQAFGNSKSRVKTNPNQASETEKTSPVSVAKTLPDNSTRDTGQIVKPINQIAEPAFAPITNYQLETPLNPAISSVTQSASQPAPDLLDTASLKAPNRTMVGQIDSKTGFSDNIELGIEGSSPDYAKRFDPIPSDYQQVSSPILTESAPTKQVNQARPNSVLSDDQLSDMEQSFAPELSPNQAQGLDHPELSPFNSSSYSQDQNQIEEFAQQYSPSQDPQGYYYNQDQAYYPEEHYSGVSVDSSTNQDQVYDYQSHYAQLENTDNTTYKQYYEQNNIDNQVTEPEVANKTQKSSKSQHYLNKLKGSVANLGDSVKNASSDLGSKVGQAGNRLKPELKTKSSKLKPNLSGKVNSISQDTKNRVSNFFARKVALPSPGIAKLAGSALALAVILVYVWQVNYPSLALKIAGARAGIATSVPGYLPSGWQLSRDIKIEDNSLTYSLVNTTDRATMAISQQSSQWTDQDLIEDYISSVSDSYQALRTGGQTLYIYGDNQISWINDGLWYRIEGDSNQLAKDQLIKIASNI
ncbi:hypothetical protein KC853_01545 [Candidatus Saccharibacteria bacterium]|nr:hypothetical protein [Candidatus Saccharibacteria bacterium]MCB9834968.1 hypothetical protein [Candidatus Nomurabacteria bacterium]